MPEIQSSLYKGKTIVIYGARQTGKTTLCRKIVAETENAEYLLCEEPDVAEALNGKNSSAMRSFLGNRQLVVLDEAQRLAEPGMTLKLLHDTCPDIQIIATGSSSFDLASHINEPLTGRKMVFHLPPISMGELDDSIGEREVDRTLERRIIYGCYPEVVTSAGTDSEEILREITRSYLFKDILSLDSVRHPEVLEKLLTALALQIGSEVSYAEIAQLIGVNRETVDRYIRILEQSFVLFRLSPFSRNIRNELKKNRKIYFWDTGVRNALIRNLSPLELRNDTGHLWENFIIAERLKRLYERSEDRGVYFWRAAKPATGEIDFLEDYNGAISPFEIKWKQKKVRLPVAFERGYPGTEIECVAKENWRGFVGR